MTTTAVYMSQSKGEQFFNSFNFNLGNLGRVAGRARRILAEWGALRKCIGHEKKQKCGQTWIRSRLSLGTSPSTDYITLH
jgi:hypothetical protein